MALRSVLAEILEPAARLLPARMDSTAARVMLLAIGQQESRFEFRRQLGNGPARGLWQFERGTRASRGGVWGVFLHEQSRGYLEVLCRARRVNFEPDAIWSALERDDILAACVARLLLWTDPKPLPSIDDVAGAWDLYAVRTWRPGKPHPQTWAGYHLASRGALGVLA
ncbi:hypothetical protein QTH87_06020 [Variovorax sp. J22P168]|uniref:hypothetical protein n=1 Tax=Variovorax jilinensis TaxID=3053513 RepID=UPI002575CFAF|nr:hypothetical protein [Variovorax sp. J22P168]MDM0011995.1 hypothetical protein [Variovorax sp. J22P168]